MRKAVQVTCSLALVLALAACTRTPEPATPGPGAEVPPAAAPQSSAPSSTTPSSSTGVPRRIEGSVVRFTAGTYSVDVTIGADTPTVRDFLSMLPATLSFTEYAGREKVSYLPRKLTVEGTPASDPVDGDLIYFVPWGNVAFYYDSSGTDLSADTLHIGKYTATPERLKGLESERVNVAVVS